jgi:hypothetical protein
MYYCRFSREQSGTAFQLAGSESVDEGGVFALAKRRVLESENFVRLSLEIS